VRHIGEVTPLLFRRRLLGGALILGFAIAPIGATMAAPGAEQRPASGSAVDSSARQGNGNGGGRNPGNGNGNGNGTGGGGGNPVITPPGRPGNPGGPAIPGGDGGSRPGGTAPGPAVAVPKGVPTAGLAAGSGAVQVRAYVDLGNITDAQAHQRVVPALLQKVAAEGLGSIALRPLVMGRDANSIEAAGALIAASRQNRAWFVAGHLISARTTKKGDWITPASLRSIGKAIGGLAVARFVRDATSRSVYPQLNTIRREAVAAKVTITPTFVVKGPRGTRVVSDPESAAEVMSAIGEVRELN